MQIHVQNAPFVYNPDTISVGLGFTEGGEKKWLLENSTSNMKVGVVLFSVICLFAVIVFLGCQCFFFHHFLRVWHHIKELTAPEKRVQGWEKRTLYLSPLCDNSYSSRQEWVKTDYYPNSNWFHITLGFCLQWHSAAVTILFRRWSSKTSSPEPPLADRVHGTDEERSFSEGGKGYVRFGVACDWDWPITIYFLWTVCVMSLSPVRDWIQWTAGWCQPATTQFELPPSSQTTTSNSTDLLNLYIRDLTFFLFLHSSSHTVRWYFWLFSQPHWSTA